MIHQPLPGFGFAKDEKENKHKIATSGQALRWQEPSMDPSTCSDSNKCRPAGPRHPDLNHRVSRERRNRDPSLGKPQIDAFRASLRACTQNKDLARGTRIHDELVQNGLLEDCVHALVLMYAKCSEFAKAKELLHMHKSRTSVVTWTALITAYAREGHGQNALDCFEQMQHEGFVPDAVTYANILKACATIGAVGMGKEVHDEIARQGLLQDDIVLGGALVDMYAKCGALSKARQVLDGLPSRNVVTWNALIAGCVQEGDTDHAMNCFEEMQREGILPDVATYTSILKACALTGAIEQGKQIHDKISRHGSLQRDSMLGAALVDMYAKCGAVSKARQVLDRLPSRDVVTWNALITGCLQGGHADQAMNSFEEMQREGIIPDAVTFICILKACAMMGAVDKGKQIHDEVLRQGLLQNDTVLGGALVDMYAKCGAVLRARQVFDGLPSQDVSSWNALIAGYVKGGHVEQALNCFEEMLCDSIVPNGATFICLVKACAMMGAADKGEQIHDKIVRHGLLQNDVVLGGALVDMYAKCGAVSMARQVHDGLPSRDVVSWSALIAGYANAGHAEQALGCLQEMQQEGIIPNVVTFTVVLKVCSHRGLVEEGQEVFLDMSTKYSLNPSLECYASMIDLFGRAGHLEKAVRLIKDAPCCDYAIIWHTLLVASQKWSDVNVGRWAFEQAVSLDRSDGAAYILMANIYAAAGMGEEALDIEAMRIRNRAWKKPGCSVGSDSSSFIQVLSDMPTTITPCI